MQITLKNPKSGQQIKDRFRVDDMVEEVFFERKPMEYLYSDTDNHVVMDPDSFEEVRIDKQLIGDMAVYLSPNIPLDVLDRRGQSPSSVDLPNVVELEVIDTPPQVKGATATNQLKDAVCEGGARVKVPAFVEIGTKIKVDTRSNEYLGRV